MEKNENKQAEQIGRAWWNMEKLFIREKGLILALPDEKIEFTVKLL